MSLLAARTDSSRPRSAIAAGVLLALVAASFTVAGPADAATEAPSGTPIANSQYILLDVDSESPPYPAPPSLDGTAAGAFDGDYATQWASKYNGGSPDPMPHFLTFDVGATHALTGVGYSVKVQGNGPAANVKVFTTNDADVAKDGTSSAWVQAGTATFRQPTSNTEVQFVAFDEPVSARYVQFRVLDAVNGSDNASASEIVVYTTDEDTNPPDPASPFQVKVDSVNTTDWKFPDDTSASTFIDRDGTFHFQQAHALYGKTSSRAWSFFTGTHLDDAVRDATISGAGTNPDTTAFCDASPTGVEATVAQGSTSYSQANYCDLTQMWVDPDTGHWYGLVHNEFTPQPFGDGLHYDSIDFAVSTDQGKTWTIPGHAITSPYSTARGDTAAFPQQTYYYGDGDPRLYVDYASGYFYAFYGSRVVNKGGSWVAFHQHVARAPIADKMATGSWQKWYDGAWTQPGIGGKESNMTPVTDASPTGYTAPDDEYDPNTPGTAQQQVSNGQMPPTSPLFVMDVTYNAHLGLYIGEPQHPDQSGKAPQEFYATDNLATQKWFKLGDTGADYTSASWYRWFVDPANKWSSAIVGKSFRSYCSFGCMDGSSAQYVNVTIDADEPAAVLDTSKTYSIGSGDQQLTVAEGGGMASSATEADAASGAWTFAATGDGAYTIASQAGTLLGVDGTRTADRAWRTSLTLTDPAEAGVGQQWFVIPSRSASTGEKTDTVRLVNRFSGLVLGLGAGKAETVPARSWDQQGDTTGGLASTRAQTLTLAEFTDSTGTTLALTPPMGWNSWNVFGCSINESIVRGVVDAIASNGMKAAGYEYITVDDCWMASTRAADGSLQADTTRFPSGMKALGDYVHSKGLKFGVYESPTEGTCQKRPGSYGHEAQDAQTFASWGVDYLKYDWCQTSTTESPKMWAENPGLTEKQLAQKLFTRMSEALEATGRPIVYSLSACCSALDFPQWAGSVGHLWRTSTDISNSWNSVLFNYGKTVGHAAAAGPGHWNDPDMLEVGNTSGTGLSPDETKAHLGLWALMAAPLVAGNDVRSASADVTGLLTNPRVLAIDQDPLGSAAVRVRDAGGIQVLTRPLVDGSRAVGILNTGSAPASVTVPLSEAGFDAGAVDLTEVFTGKESRAESAITVEVPAHGLALYRGMVDSPAALGITGPATVAAGATAEMVITAYRATEATDITVTAPDGWKVTPATTSIPRGQSKTRVTVQAPAGAFGPADIAVTGSVVDALGGDTHTVSAKTTVNATCGAQPQAPTAVVSVDSAESRLENTPGANAIDGNPSTFWGTDWSQTNAPLPHQIVVDLGASQMVCSLSYTPRQDNQNGRIKDYEVFVSDSPAAPGADATPVLKGQAAAGTATQTLAFPQPVKGRYLTLRALSEQAGNRWTTVAELAVDVRPAPALDATVSAVGKCVAGKAYLAVTVRNGEDVPVKVEMTTDYGAKSFAAVQPGASAFHSFAVRAKTLPAGTAGARVAAAVDGHEVAADLRASFEELRCG